MARCWVALSAGGAGCVAALARAHLADGHRVRALLLADVVQQLVGRGVAGRALVEIVDLLVLRRLAGGEQPVDGSDPRLQSRPAREPDAVGRGDLDAELAHPRLEPLAVARLGLGHPAHDLALALRQALRDQLVHAAGLDLAAPRLQQALADLGCRVGHRRAG